jgi:hypothetical protein
VSWSVCVMRECVYEISVCVIVCGLRVCVKVSRCEHVHIIQASVCICLCMVKFRFQCVCIRQHVCMVQIYVF